MLKTFPTYVAALLISGPVWAQNLPTQTSAPSIVGELLIHSGSFAARRSSGGDGPCEEGSLDRRVQTSSVWFDPPYLEKPQVFLNLNTFEFAQSRNARIGTSVLTVTPYFMTIAVWTWCDTILYEASGTYFALGELGEFSSPDGPPRALGPVDPEELGEW